MERFVYNKDIRMKNVVSQALDKYFEKKVLEVKRKQENIERRQTR